MSPRPRFGWTPPELRGRGAARQGDGLKPGRETVTMRRVRWIGGSVRGRFFIAAGVLAAALAGGSARAEESWARGAPLDLRSGGTLGHRVIDTVAPGER